MDNFWDFGPMSVGHRLQTAEWMSRKSGFVRCLHPEIPITLVVRDTLYGGKVQAGRHYRGPKARGLALMGVMPSLAIEEGRQGCLYGSLEGGRTDCSNTEACSAASFCQPHFRKWGPKDGWKFNSKPHLFIKNISFFELFRTSLASKFATVLIRPLTHNLTQF